MCDYLIVSAFPKGETLKAKTQNELAQRGFSHVFNLADYAEQYRLYKNKIRAQRTAMHKGWAAVEIADAIILANSDVKGDFDDYLN